MELVSSFRPLLQQISFVFTAPSDAQAAHDLAASLSSLGNLNLRTGDTESAAEFYRQGLELARGLYDRDLSISFERMGNVHRAGDTAVAADYYRQALELRRGLYDRDPSDARAGPTQS